MHHSFIINSYNLWKALPWEEFVWAGLTIYFEDLVGLCLIAKIVGLVLHPITISKESSTTLPICFKHINACHTYSMHLYGMESTFTLNSNIYINFYYKLKIILNI